MNVSQAVDRRMSVRAFTSDPVQTDQLQEIFTKAARAPSGGNLQPWRIFILNGERLAEFREIMETRLAGTPHPEGEHREYQVYPDSLKEPYRTSRFEVGEQMYGLLGIPRENRPERLQWFANNYRFFNAPAAAFCFIDRTMGAPQWADLGMYLQTVMLLLQEQGLDSCAQECWYNYPKTVSDFCGVDENWMLFCGMAIGHKDPDHPVNQLRTERRPADEWLSVL